MPSDLNTLQLRPTGIANQWASSDPTLLVAVVTRLVGPEFSFTLRSKDGTVHRYDRIVGFANTAGLASITDRHGNTVTITRASPAPGLFGLITRITEPAGRHLDLTYDPAGRITSATDPLGRTVEYTYDAAGHLASVTDPAGGVTTYAYDASHRIVTITDPRGITYLTNEYDTAGRVVRQTQADGGLFTFAYAVEGSGVTATTMTDPRGNVTVHRFNDLGLPLSTTDALGQTTVFEYTPGIGGRERHHRPPRPAPPRLAHPPPAHGPHTPRPAGERAPPRRHRAGPAGEHDRLPREHDHLRLHRSGRPGDRERSPRQHDGSEEHTSELQSQSNLVCRLLLEKKN